MPEVKSSGRQESFANGAVRDSQDGKPRYDLIHPTFLTDLAVHMARGAKHYGDRNWEKGIPSSRAMASLMRHVVAIQEGKTDEDHVAAAAFNLQVISYNRAKGWEFDDIEWAIEAEQPVGIRFDFQCIPTAAHATARKAQFQKAVDASEREAGRMKHRVYVAGPYSGICTAAVRQNVERAVEIGKALMDKGHDVLVPHAASDPLETFELYPKTECPFWGGRCQVIKGHKHSHQRWLDMDFEFIKRWATALYYIGPSKGADMELELAEKLGLTVFRSMDEVPQVTEVKVK